MHSASHRHEQHQNPLNQQAAETHLRTQGGHILSRGCQQHSWLVGGQAIWMDPCSGNRKPKHAHFIFIVDPYRCKGLFVFDRDAGWEYFSLCTLVLCQRNFLLFEWDWPTASCLPGIYLLAQSIPFWCVSKNLASFGYLWFPTIKHFYFFYQI